MLYCVSPKLSVVSPKVSVNSPKISVGSPKASVIEPENQCMRHTSRGKTMQGLAGSLYNI